jgi:hypothetical protein
MAVAETARRPANQSTRRRRQEDVLEEQIAILRQIRAPQNLIEIAERLLEQQKSARRKSKQAGPESSEACP